MWPYWLTFGIPLLLSFSHNKIDIKVYNILKYLYLIYLVLFIGLRYEVGGDWFQYEKIYQETINQYLLFNLNLKNDVLFINLINLTSYISENIVFLNFILATIFIFSINYFLDDNSDFFFIILTTLPIYVFLIGIGFVRQATAISFFLISIKLLIRNKLLRSYAFFIISLGFHKTILPFILIYFLNIKKNAHIFIILLIIIIFTIIFFNSFSRLIFYYLGQGIHFISYGSIQRLIIISFFACFFIIFHKKLVNNDIEKKIFLTLSFIVIFISPFVFHLSSAIDRLAFYAMPIQIFCIMRSKRIFKSNKNYQIFKIISCLISFIIIFVWFNFAHHKIGWLPYKNYFFSNL